MQIDSFFGGRPPLTPGNKAPDQTPLQTQARALEASFLSEMLGHAGFGDARQDFGGGIGEDQFASFLRDELAKQMVTHGGIGLAEHLFAAMQTGVKP